METRSHSQAVAHQGARGARLPNGDVTRSGSEIRRGGDPSRRRSLAEHEPEAGPERDDHDERECDRIVASPGPPLQRDVRQDQDPRLGHLLHRVAQALAAEAGVLRPAVRHLVGAEGARRRSR